MISFDEAFDIALGAARRLDTEQVELAQARNRVLAQEVRADISMPPYDMAMVDGYACRRADLGTELQVVETIAAGYAPEKAIGPGECAKIMTGAMLPEDADCVFMVEHSEPTDGGAVRFTREDTSDNILPLGKNIAEGDVLLSPGHRILASDVAVLASMGCVRPKVYKRARVAVIATGDELVEPEIRPSPVQIRSSNGVQLCAQVEAMGCVATYIGIAQDTEESLEACLKSALDGHELALFSGGVSMGEFDLVPGILEKNGIKIQYDRVAIQPGKPTTFAYSDDLFCFGLPGNPVSTFVIFELLVKPFLFAMMGHAYRPPQVRMRLASTMTRKSGARKAWVPVVTTDEGLIERVDYHGSAHINALCHAEGLIAFPEGATELPEGTEVAVRLIRT
ncbi:MAG: molybdopterin molybdotransferase MoeA [Candidatus Hydrogenedentes bacterium]|nr:molybdopterin molybdotransferase MoeA [Candidatus Hydrogenedentota bacterium]